MPVELLASVLPPRARAHTIVPQVHLHLQGLELVGQASAGLCAHLLVGPLLQAIEFLGDVHDCGG